MRRRISRRPICPPRYLGGYKRNEPIFVVVVLLSQDELDEGLADNLREELAAVARAEQRVDAGTYGLSIESGKPIPDERLEAVPAAERTADEEAR